MKTRKLFLVLGLVVIFLAGTVLVANAADKIRVTGGFNNTFFGMGWEWMNVNILLDPASDDATGKIQYMVYEDAVGSDVKFSWKAEAVCGVYGEYLDLPTVSVVMRITSVKNIPEDWVGKYAKITFSDGGQNASEDLLGITVWNFASESPVTDQPLCFFEAPMIAYPSQNGNLTIHE